MCLTTEDKVERLLCYMNDALEQKGRTIDTRNFNFSKYFKYREEIMKEIRLSDEDLDIALKTALTRRFIAYQCLDGEGYENLKLTPEGQCWAISAKAGKNRSYELGHAAVITNMTVHGPAQIGNYNTQEIRNSFRALEEKIEQADASEEEKKSAISLIKKALEHPVIASIVGGVVGGIAS